MGDDVLGWGGERQGMKNLRLTTVIYVINRFWDWYFGG